MIEGTLWALTNSVAPPASSHAISAVLLTTAKAEAYLRQRMECGMKIASLGHLKATLTEILQETL